MLTPPPVKVAALAYGFNVLQPAKIRTGEFASQLRALAPDLIVTAAYGRILPADILAIPRLGCLNVHGSLLPAYRGAAPVQWSIIDGLAETGITIMCMDEGMDTGDILLQARQPIHGDMDAGQLMDALACLGAELLPQAIDGFLSGALQPVAQDHDRATYAAMIDRQTGHLDWSKPAQALHDRVRGTYPWPGAWTTLPDGKRLKVHRARPCTDPSIEDRAAKASAGTIVATRTDAITVAAGDGALDLLEIQPEGGKRLTSSACYHNFPIGLILGG